MANDLLAETETESTYDASSIDVLDGLEAVRKRPGMYIGGTDERALHHMAAEIIDSSMDEAVAGFATRIEVTLLADHSLKVVDNGRGIPTALRRKIFGRFVRLGSELEREKPGTGLGLYIVRTLVHRMRGKVRVHNREDAAGTVFEVQLPSEFTE